MNDTTDRRCDGLTVQAFGHFGNLNKSVAVELFSRCINILIWGFCFRLERGDTRVGQRESGPEKYVWYVTHAQHFHVSKRHGTSCPLPFDGSLGQISAK